MGKYASSAQLSSLGIISAKNMTVEASITKLMYCIGKKYSYEEMKKKFTENLAGEIN